MYARQSVAVTSYLMESSRQIQWTNCAHVRRDKLINKDRCQIPLHGLSAKTKDMVTSEYGPRSEGGAVLLKGNLNTSLCSVFFKNILRGLTEKFPVTKM